MLTDAQGCWELYLILEILQEMEEEEEEGGVVAYLRDFLAINLHNWRSFA